MNSHPTPPQDPGQELSACVYSILAIQGRSTTRVPHGRPLTVTASDLPHREVDMPWDDGEDALCHCQQPRPTGDLHVCLKGSQGVFIHSDLRQ